MAFEETPAWRLPAVSRLDLGPSGQAADMVDLVAPDHASAAELAAGCQLSSPDAPGAMNGHHDLAAMSRQQLLALRKTLAGRAGDLEQVLSGSLVEQMRRSGQPRCRCAGGEPRGPYAYLALRADGHEYLRYVPSRLVETVRRCLQQGAEVDAALAGISAINAVLLARRELD